MRHFAMGATTMIEDYARGTMRKMLIIGVNALAWVIAATGLFALARIAL
jgi:succinate dehydrogenase / fumarate reductase membrane anchor subunit